ncbi:MAG TPA: hypothetical protein VJV05_15615 [Pyrinomonadaceae bacterium]|nr:hypothetical protein [Pyrinomonadaceae bacterium]
MSKPFGLFVAVVILLGCSSFASAQADKRADITIHIGQNPATSVRIRGSLGSRKQLSFLQSIAGIKGLESRIQNLELSTTEGRAITHRLISTGEILADSEFTRFAYDVDLRPRRERSAAAHTSWLNGDAGILMLRDVLPLFKMQQVTVTLESTVPIYTNNLLSSERTFTYSDANEVVYFVGEGWRPHAVLRCKGTPLINVSGEWHFTDEEAGGLLADIVEAYENLFGLAIKPTMQVAIARFPIPTEAGMWEAETIGRNVIIISSDTPFKQQSVQRLHEQLRHEVFHLWIPNGVNLTGNYDWFYEGFALYQSLRMAVAMNRISFNDFLDTLSRAHTIDTAQSQRLSLIDASKSRFSGSNTRVYARGMLVAFLSDLVLLEGSKGNRSVEHMLRDLYLKHKKPAAPVDGNTAVIELLKSNPGLEQIINKYVTGSENIDWTSQIAVAGIADTDPGLITTLKVIEKLNGRQKTLLDKLGYNNWRKLAPDSK